MNSENDDTDDTNNGFFGLRQKPQGSSGHRLRAAQPACRPASFSGSAAVPSLTAS